MRKLTIMTLFLTSGLLGCEPQRPDLHVPVGHPANPHAATGLRIGAPGALQPEMIRAEPASTSRATNPPNPLSPIDRRRKTTGHKH